MARASLTSHTVAGFGADFGDSCDAVIRDNGRTIIAAEQHIQWVGQQPSFFLNI